MTRGTGPEAGIETQDDMRLCDPHVQTFNTVQASALPEFLSLRKGRSAVHALQPVWTFAYRHRGLEKMAHVANRVPLS